MKSALASASLCFLLATPTLAQGGDPPVCGENEEFIECFNRIEAKALEAASDDDAVVKAVHEETANKLASEGSAAGDDNLRDTLASFFGALDLGTISREGQSITLNFNPDRLRFGPRNKVSLGVEMREPEVFSSLLEAVPEDQRASRKDALAEQLEDLDDVTISVGWNRESQHHGRSARPHKALFRAVAGFEATTQPFVDLLGETGVSLRGSMSALRAKDPALARRFQRALVSMACSIPDRLGADKFLLEECSLLDDLLNNQPQLQISGSWRERADLVGRDELFGKISYEWGWANLNAYRRSLAGQAPNPVSFADFLEENDLLAEDGGPGPMLKYGLRLSGSLEVSRLQPYHAPSEAQVTLDLDGSEKWTGAISVGSAIAFDAKGNPTSRWELVGSYERVDDDSTRPETRILGTLSVIQELTDGTSVSLGVVYANKPELLKDQDLDHEVSARVGIKYSLDRKPKAGG